MQNNKRDTSDTDYWMELRRKSLERNASFRKRMITGTHEQTHYSEDNSSVYLWINKEPGGFPLHWHSTVEIIMPLSGTYTVVMNKSTYRLQEHEILIIPPGDLHELLPPDSGYRLILLFDLSALNKFKGFTRLFSLFSLSSHITPETMPEIYEKERDLLFQVIEEYADGSPERGKCLLKSICDEMGFDSLGYQTLDGLLEAIGLDRSKVCTYCWTGEE